jgi:adenine deaminase
MSGQPRPELLPTVDELMLARRVATGAAPADLIVRGGQVLAVHTGELLERDVVVSGRHIAAVTPSGRMTAGAGTVELDAAGLHVVPTFIDAHLHIEYTMLTPGELARLTVPRGTVCVLTDPDCMANVAGTAGMDVMRTTGTPLRIFEQVSPTTPVVPGLERGGAIIPEAAVLERLAEPTSVTLGESSPFDESRVAAERYLTALRHGRRITGHTARLSGEPLWSYLAAGVGDDHNAATADEALERIRLGAMLTLMAGSMNDNTAAVFADLDRVRPAFGHICFCADDKHVLDLATEGHIDHHVRAAIAAGVPAVNAYRMASWNAALYYRLDQLVGAVIPARLADLAIIGDLAAARPELVVVGGAVVAENGRALFANTDEIPAWTRETVRLADDFGPARLAVAAREPAAQTAWVQAMEMYDGYFKRAFHVELPVVDGLVQPDVERDVLKIAVIDRHHGDGLTGVGFVRGFTLRSGALAISTNCTNANVVAVGTSDADLVAAVRALRELGGGFVAVADGAVLAAVALPVGGLMSDAPFERTRDALAAAQDAAVALGCGIRSPYLVLSFVGLAVVPDLGLTELGLVDAVAQRFTDVVLDLRETGVTCRCPSHGYPVHALMDPSTTDGGPGQRTP